MGLLAFMLGYLLIYQVIPPLNTVVPFQPIKRFGEENSKLAFSDVSWIPGIRANCQGDDKLIGKAWSDYDCDGSLDLYVTDSAGPNTLYQNTQQGTIEVINKPSITLPTTVSNGAVFTD